MSVWATYQQTCYRWIREGGTPKWFLGMLLLMTPRIYLGLFLWLGALYLVYNFTPTPDLLMKMVGIAAIGLWILDKLGPSTPDYSRSPKTNRGEAE